MKVSSLESGQTFDWRVVLGDYLTIHVNNEKPVDTQLCINYRGHWFYIDDTDLESKSTFNFLSQIFSLQAGKAEGIVLTHAPCRQVTLISTSHEERVLSGG